MKILILILMVLSNVVVASDNKHTNYGVSDSAITTEIKAKFLADKDINGLAIKVETNNGMVTLSGEVPTQEMIDHSISLARGVDGVKGIDNHLAIAKDKSKMSNVISDAAITTAVKTKFLADKEINGLAIKVETANGVVKLTGDVPSHNMIEHATHVAEDVDGVKAVNSELKVAKPRK
jgi:hyperosmotically inducible protein